MKIRAIPFFIVAAALLLIASVAQAQLSADDARQLEQWYKGRIVKVRDLLSDSTIRYDAAGKLVGKWHPGRWTWHSSVEITKVDVKDRLLKIKANRLLLNYDPRTHLFTPLQVQATPIEFEIETSVGADGKIDLRKEWDKAFLKPAEDYPLEMQPYWKPFISCILKPDTDECKFYEKKAGQQHGSKAGPSPAWKPSYPGTYDVGNGVTPPKVKSRVEPEYTEIARYQRIAGSVLLEAIVRKTGVIEIVRVVRPLGYGLEESAADALSKWSFEPGTLDGQPVDILVNVEVNFKLQR